MLLVLPSCGIPRLHKPEPGPNLPESFNGTTSPENSSMLGVDEFYHDANLSGLIYQSLANNRELKNLEQEVQVASNEVLARSGAYLPFVSAATGAGMDRPSRFTRDGAVDRQLNIIPGQAFPNPLGNFMAGFNVNWQVDIYRQLRNARDAALERYQAAIDRRNYFVTRMVADIAENYYRLMGLDKRIENLDTIIELQERSLQIAQARKEAARGTELAVQRFLAEVRKNQSEKLIIYQDIVQTENRINYILNRFPQPVQRDSSNFFNLTINTLNVGVPSQLLQNRPDIRQTERELVGSGLDVKVARANFYPQLVITAGIGYEAFNLKYLFNPQAFIANAAGGFVAPFVNRRAIKAQYLSANARQLQAVYNYQRTILNAFTEVINRLAMVENYRKSIEIKKLQLQSLESSVDLAGRLFQSARTEYIDVLFAQRDLMDARMVLIQTKAEQLSAIVNAYQALGGGNMLMLAGPGGLGSQFPIIHVVQNGDTFSSISTQYYKSARYQKSLWAANKKVVRSMDRLAVGEKIIIPRVDQLEPSLIEAGSDPEPAPALAALPAGDPTAAPPPPPAGAAPGPFVGPDSNSPTATEPPAAVPSSGSVPAAPAGPQEPNVGAAALPTAVVPPAANLPAPGGPQEVSPSALPELPPVPLDPATTVK
ncbi:TolC family protein [Singulisphaera sp. PoT]|uniref:TolC family protein n=1 Tax=Singulisphaera sp. PoT TaxID=3411797 RepID=UPI003BF4C388